MLIIGCIVTSKNYPVKVTFYRKKCSRVSCKLCEKYFKMFSSLQNKETKCNCKGKCKNITAITIEELLKFLD